MLIVIEWLRLFWPVVVFAFLWMSWHGLFGPIKGFKRKNYKAEHHQRMIKSADLVHRKLTMAEGGFSAAQKLTYLRKMSPYAFEELLLTAFQQKGYTILRNKSYSGDGGWDGQVCDAQGQIYLIQAKRYSSAVSRAHVIQFIQLVAQTGHKGFFIHTGRTPASLFAEAQTGKVTIVSGERLLKLLNPSAIDGWQADRL